MTGDKIEILGRWRVKFGQYIWEYLFTDDGIVQWKNPFNNENGTGRWSITPKTVYLSWSKSTTKETWNRPVKRTGQSGWIEASYRTGAFDAEKIGQIRLPESETETDLELDPTTGEFVQSDPKTHKLYIDRVFSAVAYGILQEGYYIYCQGMELPILLSEILVDFGLANTESERSKIFDSYGEAKLVANDSAGRRRVAYF